MKTEIRQSCLFLAAFTLLVLASPAAAAETAESPRAALTRLTTELAHSGCGSLFHLSDLGGMQRREDAIRIAQSLQPPPVPPEESEKAMAKGRVLMRSATTASDYTAAAEAFCKALDLAPWWPDAYYNLAKALEKTGNFQDARDAFRLYLFAVPQADNAKAIKDRIYELEAMQELAQKKVARMEHVKTILEWFKTNYGATRIKAKLLCLVCTEAEAAGQAKWVHPWPVGSNMKGDFEAEWLRANEFLRFELQGEEIKLDGLLAGKFCGKVPESGNAAEMEWRRCSAGTPAKIRLLYSKSKRPLIESATDCQGRGGEEECWRERVFLE